MPDQMSVEDILSRNPHIHPKELEDSLELLRALRKRGVRGSRYDLGQPHARRLAVTNGKGQAIDDTATTDLSRQSHT